MKIMRRGSTIASVLLALGFAIALTPVTAASDVGMAAADEVTEAGYRDFLDNWLFTRAGDSRGVGGLEHDLARDNIEILFLIFGLDVVLEPFQYQATTYYNVVGTMHGTVDPTQEYIVGAHFDSVNNPGADDNASGVALVLEAARVLSQYPSDYTIRFIAFDREEQGLIGSNAYVASHVGDNIVGMISTDMVAYNTGTNSATIHAGGSSGPLQGLLAGAVTEYGNGLTPLPAGANGSSDHAPFESAGYEACLLIEDWGNPYYHTQQDNIDTPGYIDYAFATRFTRSVVGLLTDLAGVDVPANTLTFAMPAGLPDYVDPDGGTTVRVEVTGVGTETPRPGTGLLHYDAGAGWQSVPMNDVSPDVYDAVFPWTTCPGEVSYYFSAEALSGASYTDPHNAPATSYATIAAYGQIVSFHEDFEVAAGWTDEVLGATSGQWQRGVPVDDPLWDYDPASDADGSGQCYLTQNAPGNTDVDGGAVRLTSPVFDMSAGGLLGYAYYLNLSNATGGVDMLLVEASNDGGIGGWVEIARHDTSGGLTWRTHEITTDALVAAGVAPTASMRIRFTANDADPQSVVEAGVDALRLHDFDCLDPCAADVDGDGGVGIGDLLDLLAAWGGAGGPADVDDDGVVGIADFLAVLAGWGPCPP